MRFVYRLSDGTFTGQGFYLQPYDEARVAEHVPERCSSIEGPVDVLSQRVDLETGELVAWQPPRPADNAAMTWAWDEPTARWVSSPTLATVQATACAAIDAAAGAARLRYMTDVTGQQAVYIRKAEQARAFAASGYSGAAPPYIAAEAAARTMTPQALADEILTVAAQWDDQISPQVEALRVQGKKSVQTCTSLEAVQASAQTTLNSLESL